MRSLKFLLAAGLVSVSTTAFATSAGECKPKLDKARSSLVEMLGGKKDDAQQKLVKQTADDAGACIDGIKAAGKDAQVAELKKVWGEFKATREKQLVPAILAGKGDEAKTMATGIQKERMDKINSLIKQIQGGDL
jgi:hypothetical protein